MRSELRVEAREDLAEAAEFYDRRRSGLGDYFVACIFADLKALECWDYKRGFTKRYLGFIANLQPVVRSQFTTFLTVLLSMS